MTRCEPNPCGELPGVSEEFEIRDFRNDNLLGDFAKSRNTIEEFLLGMEF